MKREERGMERVDGKAAGDYGFITCQRIGLADGARADAIPNAAGVNLPTLHEDLAFFSFNKRVELPITTALQLYW
jgi:hypothetical protein